MSDNRSSEERCTHGVLTGLHCPHCNIEATLALRPSDQRRAALDELVRLSEEMGGYDLPTSKPTPFDTTTPAPYWTGSAPPVPPLSSNSWAEAQHPEGERFIECDTCRAKSSSPTLCAGCLHNRNLISSLRERIYQNAQLASNPVVAERDQLRLALREIVALLDPTRYSYANAQQARTVAASVLMGATADVADAVHKPDCSLSRYRAGYPGVDPECDCQCLP